MTELSFPTFQGMVYRFQIQAPGVGPGRIAETRSMAAKIVHFGIDSCYRLGVLRRAGYVIENCSNLEEVCAAVKPDRETDAIMINDSDGSLPPHAISLVRTRTTAPIIVFPSSLRLYQPQEIDLLVPAFTPPEEWLIDLANLIVQGRALRAYSRSLQEQSQSLRRDSLAIRVTSIRERERARRILETRLPSPFDPDWHSK